MRAREYSREIMGLHKLNVHNVKQSTKCDSLKVSGHRNIMYSYARSSLREYFCDSHKCVGIKSVTHCRDAVRMVACADVVVRLSISLSLDVLARNLSLKDTDIDCLRTFSDNESRRSTLRNFA